MICWFYSMIWTMTPVRWSVAARSLWVRVVVDSVSVAPQAQLAAATATDHLGGRHVTWKAEAKYPSVKWTKIRAPSGACATYCW